MPKSAMPSGINMDVAMAGVIVSAKDGNTSQELAYMNMHGLVGSYYEHDIFEKIDGFSSVSAVKALQTAAASGIPIQHINTANISQILPILQVSSEIKADVQNAVNAGKEVTISQANVQINDWRGAGYIIKDTITGAGAYMISGGLAGGDSTSNKDGMRIVEINKDPGGWVKDNVDPQTRNTVVTAAELNVGELLSVADATVGMSYDTINQCVGLVRIAYWAAGICIDQWSPWAPPGGTGSCGQKNLVQKHHITGTNGVSYFYDLANHLNISVDNGETSGVRTKNNPLAGDLVFWDNTWDKNSDCTANDERTHVGIVKWAPDEFGTLLFIQASGRGVSTDNLMNSTAGYSSNSRFNTFLRNSWKPDNPCTQEQWNSVGKLAGQLFAGFGTIRDVVCTDPSHQ